MSFKCFLLPQSYYLKLFQSEKKPCVCLILFNQYHYTWKDWFDGKGYRVSLSDAIEHKEKHDIDKIKNHNFKIELTKLNC